MHRLGHLSQFPVRSVDDSYSRRVAPSSPANAQQRTLSTEGDVLCSLHFMVTGDVTKVVRKTGGFSSSSRNLVLTLLAAPTMNATMRQHGKIFLQREDHDSHQIIIMRRVGRAREL